MTHAKLISTVAALVLMPAMVWSQQPMAGMAGLDFHINVLDGEDGVNIIKKKTAVKPVVEVKDKNGLPIAGVAVVIGLGAAGVFDSGAHEATVLTNANGIATAPDFRPLAKGPFTIQVRASYQGVTQTATIRQTNFMTVANALKAGKTPGSSQANSGAQSGSQAASAAPQATSAVASSGGGHGALVAVLAVGGAAAGVGAAYAAGVIGKSKSTATTNTNTGSSCNIQVANNLTSAINTFSNTCPNGGNASCATAATNAANALANFCSACGVNNLSSVTGVPVSQEYSSFQAFGASAASLANLQSTCR